MMECICLYIYISWITFCFKRRCIWIEREFIKASWGIDRYIWPSSVQGIACLMPLINWIHMNQLRLICIKTHTYILGTYIWKRCLQKRSGFNVIALLQSQRSQIIIFGQYEASSHTMSCILISMAKYKTADALEILQYCTNPSIWAYVGKIPFRYVKLLLRNALLWI